MPWLEALRHLPNLLDEKPNKGHIRDLYNHVLNDEAWQAQRDLDTKLLDLYFNEHGIEAPDTNEKGRKRRIKPERGSTGEASRIIDLIVSFYIAWPRFSMQLLSETQAAQSVGEKSALGLNEGFDQLNQGTHSPWVDGMWYQLLLGRRADLVIATNKHYHDFPVKGGEETEASWAKRLQEFQRKSPLPVMWINLPAETTFPASLSTVNDEVLSYQRLTYTDLFDMFSGKELEGVMPEEKGDWRRNITLGIHSNRNHLAYIFLGEDDGTSKSGWWGFNRDWPDKILRNVEHGMGRCAIRINAGLKTGRQTPPYRWRSILANVVESLESVDRLLTRAKTSAKFSSMPLLKEKRTKTNEEDGDGAEANITTWHEGDVVQLDAGDPASGRPAEDISAIFMPDSGDETRELLIWELERIARRTGAVEVLEGAFGPPGQPAWSKNVSAEFAQGKLAGSTMSAIGSALDIAETLSAAVQSFGEPIILAKLDSDGNKKGTVRLDPEDLAKFRPALAGSYTAQIQTNELAALDAMGSLINQSLETGFGPSPQWLMEKLGNIPDPWKHYRDTLEVKYAVSNEVQAAQIADIVKQFEAEIKGDEEMPMDEFMAGPGPQLPQEIQQMIQARARGQVPTAGGTVLPQTQGDIRAGKPFSVPAGGPNPTQRGA